MFQNNQIRHLQTPVHAETGKKIKNYVYEYHDLIGRGNFAKVYKGHKLNTQQNVAVKLISLDELKSKQLEALVFEEIRILQTMNHPNILQFVEALLSQRNCYLVTELCNQGSLDDRIKSKIPLSEIQLGNIILDLFNGLVYLRQKGVTHRDFKPANILINNRKMKIADFGLAKFHKQRFHDLDIGSPHYMSPQGLILNYYSQKTDIWSLGITIYELLHGTTPFINCRNYQQLFNAITRPIPEHKWRRDINPMLRQMLYKLLQIDEFKRPNIFQLANQPYIRMLIEKQNQRKMQMNLSRSMSFSGFMNFGQNEQKFSENDLDQFDNFYNKNEKLENQHLYSTKGSQKSAGQKKTFLQNVVSMKCLTPNSQDSYPMRFSFAKMGLRNNGSDQSQNSQASNLLQSNQTASYTFLFSQRQTTVNRNQIYQSNQNQTFTLQNIRSAKVFNYQPNRQQYNAPPVSRQILFN